MAATNTPVAKTPWHLWTVGVISLLWNAMGALDFTMTQTKNEAYLKAFSPEKLDYFSSFPFWVVAAWGIATWGSVAGSGLLLFRRGLAYQVNLVVFLCMIATMIHNYILTDGLKIMGGSVVTVIFSAVIMVVGLLLVVYARAMRKCGVLR